MYSTLGQLFGRMLHSYPSPDVGLQKKLLQFDLKRHFKPSKYHIKTGIIQQKMQGLKLSVLLSLFSLFRSIHPIHSVENLPLVPLSAEVVVGGDDVNVVIV